MAKKSAAENLPEVAAAELPENIVSSLILNGDLSKLNQIEKIEYYKAYCERIGLDPVTQPFKILNMKGKEVLYCDRSGTQQLNKLHSVSHRIVGRETMNGVYIVIAQAFLQNGRQTESIGAVTIEGLKGDNLCNALMKAETKAKRRSTLDLLGLGILDDSEIETIPNAVTKPVISEFDRLSAKLKESTALIHLERIWKKHWREISALPEFDKIESLKNELKAEFESAIAAKQKAAQPAEPERITADQLDRIREIIKSGGTGSKVLTELERENLCSFANDPYSLRIDAEAYLSKIKSLITEREDILMFEELHAAEQQRESELAEDD